MKRYLPILTSVLVLFAFVVFAEDGFSSQTSEHASDRAKEKANEHAVFNFGPSPNENAKSHANDNAPFPTDPKPQPTCLPKGTRCSLIQTRRVFLDTVRHTFECITPDGSTYYQYDTVSPDGETTTALTKFLGETANKCIAYYASVDPQTCKILWYTQQNRCGTESTPVYSSP